MKYAFWSGWDILSKSRFLKSLEMDENILSERYFVANVTIHSL